MLLFIFATAFVFVAPCVHSRYVVNVSHQLVHQSYTLHLSVGWQIMFFRQYVVRYRDRKKYNCNSLVRQVRDNILEPWTTIRQDGFTNTLGEIQRMSQEDLSFQKVKESAERRALVGSVDAETR